MIGIELIAKERKEQIEKHNRRLESDVIHNDKEQLRQAAMSLLVPEISKRILLCPGNWNKNQWFKMCSKSYEERLIISGALIAAEIDRINIINKNNERKNTF